MSLDLNLVDIRQLKELVGSKSSGQDDGKGSAPPCLKAGAIEAVGSKSSGPHLLALPCLKARATEAVGSKSSDPHSTACPT